MRTWLVTLVASLCVATAIAAQKPDAVPKEMEPLQGTWYDAINGNATPGDTAVAISGSKSSSEIVDSAVDETGLFRIDAAKSPMTVNLVIETGDSAGRTQLGIFDVKGDILRLSSTPLGRPCGQRRSTRLTASFSSSPSGNLNLPRARPARRAGVADGYRYACSPCRVLVESDSSSSVASP